MEIQGRENTFNKEFENLWKETFKPTLFSNPKIINSPWFNFYAESYIYYQEYVNGNFTKEKLDELSNTKQTKRHRIAKAKEYLPKELQEHFIANYLYEESFQKKYEKELIDLFADFKSEYPNSKYSTYISPLIDEIVKFHKSAETEFNEKMQFIKNYENLNSLAEVVGNIPEKHIYIDVWATWCGPCKAEFEHKAALKKLLGEYNIPVLYISIDREKDDEQWKNMIKFYQLEGYHIRANDELSAELRKIFDKNGTLYIPWYILVNSKGTVLKKHAKKPSQIKALEKELGELGLETR